ncbi:MAG: CBS domain-containing protein [Deltaproteobacteria bacterium]|nr:CBS domain-containing protein [Deltaproteobacteria bacterium]
MEVSSLMIEKPITVSDRTSVQEAIYLMEENGIRHLPVVNQSQKLVGWVTLGDMKQGLLPAVVTGLSLADLMIKDPITVHPDADIETAARLIFEKKIGGMPVVDGNDKVVGVITVTDILGAFIKIMGILSNGLIIDVDVGEREDGFENVSRIIRDNGGQIVSVGIAPDSPSANGRTIHHFRLKKCPEQPIVKALKEGGYNVFSSS